MNGITRRSMLMAATALPLCPLLHGCRDRTAVAEDFFDAVADIVIPRTGTSGAKDVGAGAYMQRAFAHGLFGAGDDTAQALRRILDARTPGGSFLSAAPSVRLATLTRLDTDTFSSTATAAAGAPLQPGTTQAAGATPPAIDVSLSEPTRIWRIAKNAIVVGYYMSEPGASTELMYEPVPGRFDPDIPYRPGDKYLANNWQANIG